MKLLLESNELILRILSNNSEGEEREISEMLGKLNETLNPTKQEKAYEKSYTQYK